MSDDTPTERFEAPLQPAPAESGGKKSRTLIVILAIIGLLLLIGVVVLVTLLVARGSGGPATEPGAQSSMTPSTGPSVTPSVTPSVAPSPSPSPSPSKTPAPPPSTGPVFTSFSPNNNTSVGCTNTTDPVSVTFTWDSSGATEAAIGVGTTDAFAGPYQTGLPPSGSFDLNYQCSNDSQIYTVSIRGTTGQTNKTITLKR